MSRIALGILLCLLSRIDFVDPALSQPRTTQVLIKGGSFEPLYDARAKPLPIKIKSFLLDVTPVTNRDYLEFIRLNPSWSKNEVAPLFADQHYLEFLDSKRSGLSEEELNAPVTYVSWFASQQYCKWKESRLPTLLEWEYAAAASESKRDASKDPKFVQSLLAWYGRPNQLTLASVGSRKPNIWGIYDMHGLVWEWVADFNSVFVAGDNRREGDDLKNIFCASDALSSNDKSNYAAFMRYALRSSLNGNYALRNLGFRCARSVSIQTSVKKK